MAHAEICPVCGGTGKIPILTSRESTAAPGEETCHGCDGKGWVPVRDREKYQPGIGQDVYNEDYEEFKKWEEPYLDPSIMMEHRQLSMILI